MNTPLVVDVGETLSGVMVTATVSRVDSMAEIAKATGLFATHIALSTRPSLKWSEAPEITASRLTLAFEEHKDKVIPALFPGLTAGDLDYQILGNSPGAAHREDVHAHVRIAVKAVWKRKVVPRLVDPLTPVPPKEPERTDGEP